MSLFWEQWVLPKNYKLLESNLITWLKLLCCSDYPFGLWVFCSSNYWVFTEFYRKKRLCKSFRWHSTHFSKDVIQRHTQKKIKQGHNMGNAWIFPSISHNTRKCKKTFGMKKVWEIDTHTFPISMSAFVPLDSHSMLYFIIWERHGFPHKFSIVQENATKPIVWGEPGKLVLILSP